MDMFERFTERSRRILVLAQEEARLLGHNFIGTEHLLLGLLHEGDGVGARALGALGISLEPARELVRKIIGPAHSGSHAAPSPPFTPRAKKVLELSLRESLQLGHDHIDTGHILLGLVREGEGVATQVILASGVEVSQVRQKVTELLPTAEEGEPLTPPGVQPHPWRPWAAGPAAAQVCAFCERDLWEVDQYVSGARASICGACAATAHDLVTRSPAAEHGLGLALPPRVFGTPPDATAPDAVMAAIEAALGPDSQRDPERRSRHLQDAEELRPYQDLAASRAGRLERVQVLRIRFLRPDLAAARLNLTVARASFTVDVTAVRQEDRWLVSRDSMADLLARGGVRVPPRPSPGDPPQP